MGRHLQGGSGEGHGKPLDAVWIICMIRTIRYEKFSFDLTNIHKMDTKNSQNNSLWITQNVVSCGIRPNTVEVTA